MRNKTIVFAISQESADTNFVQNGRFFGFYDTDKKTKLAIWRTPQLKKANNFLKKTKIISTIGKTYGSTGGPGSATIGRVGNIAGNLGYGKKRRKRGGCKK